MARIRTIKPEFWTDERLTECSLSARLLFIGMLNFADDNGNLAYSAKRLKMQVFPADAIDTQPLIDELLAHGVLIEYSVNGDKYLNIKGFSKHQVINRPSASSIPQPPNTDDSVSTHGALTDGKEGKGEEGNKEESAGEPATPPASDSEKQKPRSVTLSTYLDTCKALATKAIPDGHHIRRYCADAGITDEMTAIAWLRFREEHTTGARKAKRYVDWPETFANCVKSSWYGLWVCNTEGPANWTSKGLQEKRVADARRAEKEASHEHA